MTRINCIDVKELTNLHLLAEYRELPRISKLAKKIKDAPSSYTLGKGHVKFFYDKGAFLKHRFENEIVPELERRGYTLNFKTYREHPEGLNNDWVPDELAREINRERINTRLKETSLKNKEKEHEKKI